MLDEQIALNFIGHTKELGLFEHWLNDRQENAPRILFFHDATDDHQQKGGVGKTWLLRKCMMNVQQKRPDSIMIMVDFFSIPDRDGVEIAYRLVRQVQTAFSWWQPVAFLNTLSEYQAALRESTNVSEVQATLHEALARDLELLNTHLEHHHRYILILFDTFELIENHPITAVLGVGQTFPDTYHFPHIRCIIAGRNAPDWEHPNWQGRKQEVQCVPIEPFSQEEMVQFLNENGTILQEPLEVGSTYAQELHKRTAGRPILVGLATDLLNHRILTLTQITEINTLNFEKYLVSQINSLDNPVNWVILFMAHIYHRFTADLLHWLFMDSLDIQNLVQEINPQTLFEKLFMLSFVRGSASGAYITLHDEMRRLVNTYNWPEQEMNTGLYRRDLSVGVVRYYEYENQKKTTSEIMRQTNTVELLYHKTYVDLHEGFRFFEQEFQHAIDLWQYAFARSLFQEIGKFRDSLTLEQHYTLMYDEAVLLAREQQYHEALAIFLQLETYIQREMKDWLTLRRKAVLLYEKGSCYLQIRQFDEAITSFNECLDLEKKLGNDARVAFILSYLGNICRRQGDLQQAAEYYERSLALYKGQKNRRGYANTLYNVSLLSRLQGRFEEALRQCSMTLRIRQELYEQGDTAEVAVGFSLDGLGAIYLKLGDLIQAQKYFQEAYEIYARNKRRGSLASIYNRFGQVAMGKNDLALAMEWHQRAYQEALGVSADAEINSLDKQGRVMLEQKQFQEAITYFQQAIQRAIEMRDFYQQVEALVDLATVYERIEDYESARQALRNVEEICSKYPYYYLLGTATNLRGDSRYKEHEYKLAFEHYGRYCYYMALYNQAEYERAVRKITGLLLELPLSQEDVFGLLESLEAYWNSLQLAESSSLMMGALKEVRLLMDV